MIKTIAALFACVCLATGCAASTRLGARPDPMRWSQIETPHFSLSTNLDESAALEMARSLEEARAALLELAWTGGRDPRGRTPVVVFARPTEFEHYVGRPRLAGIAVSAPGFERLLSFRPGGHTGIPPVVIHELVHELSQWFMPMQPPWFAEGLAEYLSTLRYDRAAQQATIGEGSERNLEWLFHTGVFIRSSRLLATRSVERNDPREVASFYASSWLLVHYLLNREGEAFGQFQLDLTRLVPWQVARRAVQAHPDSGAAWLLLAHAETNAAEQADATSRAYTSALWRRAGAATRPARWRSTPMRCSLRNVACPGPPATWRAGSSCGTPGASWVRAVRQAPPVPSHPRPEDRQRRSAIATA